LTKAHLPQTHRTTTLRQTKKNKKKNKKSKKAPFSGGFRAKHGGRTGVYPFDEVLCGPFLWYVFAGKNTKKREKK
jgi:hypothetical protein